MSDTMILYVLLHGIAVFECIGKYSQCSVNQRQNAGFAFIEFKGGKR